jgi:hypothetical protein
LDEIGGENNFWLVHEKPRTIVKVTVCGITW